MTIPITKHPILIQSRFGSKGNFELIVPLEQGGLAHYWRDNDDTDFPWYGPIIFGIDAGKIDTVTMIQSNFGDPGNLEIVASTGDRLIFFWRDENGWNGPFPIIADGNAVSGVYGNPVLVQSRFGSKGNFELIVPLEQGGLAHYWRDNDNSDMPWHGPIVFGTSSDWLMFAAVTMIQSNFGNNLEVVGHTFTPSLFAEPMDHGLQFFWRDENGWNGPFPIVPMEGITLYHEITTSGITALGGWVKVTLKPDGTVRFRGHVHDSGFESYDFRISVIVRTLNGIAIAMQHAGHVGGTISSDDRDENWDETNHHPLIAEHYNLFQHAHLEVFEHHEGNITTSLEEIADTVMRWVGGSILVNPVVGLIIFVGAEIVSLIETGSLVPGARIVEGILWMAGPWGTLYALAAEGVASIGSQTRELSEEEYNFAQKVFQGTLPPREQLILTDTIGPGNRAFTFPRFDGKITINLGSDGFSDPRSYRQNGEVYIHELVHAWQIHHTHMELALLADALASKVCEATGTNPYIYANKGFPPFNDFNLEQQAQIVQDWFIKYYTRNSESDNNGLNSQNAINDPYFRYIEGNIRIGSV